MGAFKQVREAFTQRFLEGLASLSVTVVGKRADGDWWQVRCPCCSDQSGSASVSINSGHLKCHQCGVNLDLFAWVMQVHGIGQKLQACEFVASKVGVEIGGTRTRTRRRSPTMNEEFLDQCVSDLCFSPQAQACRDFLAARGLGDPEWCEKLDVGFHEGKLIFAQRDEAALLKPRWRTYAPGAKQPWGWAGPRPRGNDTTNGFWPCYPPPADALIFLTEGEWDTWTGYEVLELHKQKGFLYTYTGGAKAIPAPQMPSWLRDRKVLVIPDNDVFQGPVWKDHVAPGDKKRLEMERRRKGLYATCETLLQLGNKVRVAKIPMDPLSHWGADLRDWVAQGGRDISLLPSWLFTELLEAEKPQVLSVDFHEVWSHVGLPVTFLARLDQTGGHVVTPVVTSIDCEKNEFTACNSCRVPNHFPLQVIEWSKIPELLLRTALAREPEREVEKSVLGRPRSCPHCLLKHEAFTTCFPWIAAAPEDGDSTADRSIEMLSEDEPSISSVMRITGTPYHLADRRIGVLVHKLEVFDSTDIDLLPGAAKARDIIARDVARIDTAIQDLVDDIAWNTTKILGRREMHIAMMLAYCSPRWIKVNKKKVRGWIDISILGGTGTGKTDMWNSFIAAVGLGTLHTSMTNTSRAGFVMGAVSARTGSEHRVRPGLYPRANGKLIVVDEAHMMGETIEGRILGMLQSARETGYLEGVKVYGPKRMPAQVRLVTIANPFTKGGARYYRYACENLIPIYGTAEAIRRLDFCLWVSGLHEEGEPVPHLATAPFLRDTILRAWGLTEEDVVIEPEAEELAAKITREWGETYNPDGDIPLYSGADMTASVLRIASAVANMLWHTVTDDISKTKVEVEHVRWAAAWLEWTWEQNGYNHVTKREARNKVLTDPIGLEIELLVNNGLSEPEHACRVLDELTGEFTPGDLAMLFSKEVRDINQLVGPMLRMGAILVREGTKRQGRSYIFTPGAQTYIQSLARIARLSPTVYRDRYERIHGWNQRGRPGKLDLERADEIDARLDVSGELE